MFQLKATCHVITSNKLLFTSRKIKLFLLQFKVQLKIRETEENRA